MTAYDLATTRDLQTLVETTPIHLWLAFKVVSVDAVQGALTMIAPIGANARRFSGGDSAHGGVIAALIDTTATFACSALLRRPVPTMNLRVDYLRPAAGSELVAKATVRRCGRTAAVIDVDVEADGKLVAIGRCVQATAAPDSERTVS